MLKLGCGCWFWGVERRCVLGVCGQRFLRLGSYGDSGLFERCVLDSLWDRRERMRNDGSRVKYAYHGEMDGLWARYLICYTLKSFGSGSRMMFLSLV